MRGFRAGGEDSYRQDEIATHSATKTFGCCAEEERSCDCDICVGTKQITNRNPSDLVKFARIYMLSFLNSSCPSLTYQRKFRGAFYIPTVGYTDEINLLVIPRKLDFFLHCLQIFRLFNQDFWAPPGQPVFRATLVCNRQQSHRAGAQNPTSKHVTRKII